MATLVLVMKLKITSEAGWLSGSVISFITLDWSDYEGKHKLKKVIVEVAKHSIANMNN